MLEVYTSYKLTVGSTLQQQYFTIKRTLRLPPPLVLVHPGKESQLLNCRMLRLAPSSGPTLRALAC